MGIGPIFAPAGDVNDDGYDDVLIDADVNTNGALLLLGTASGVPSGTAASIGVPVPFTGSVQSLAGAGDVDGHDDVMVGDPTHCNQPGCTYVNGRAELYFGGAGGLDLTRQPIPFVSPYPADTLLEAGVGTILDGVGDVNLDGLSDILVGRFTSTDPRSIQLFHGGDNSVVPVGVPALSAPVAALAVLLLAAAGLATPTSEGSTPCYRRERRSSD